MRRAELYSLQHFFLENLQKITSEEQIHQIQKVLRYRSGQKIIGIYQEKRFLIELLFEKAKKSKVINLKVLTSLSGFSEEVEQDFLLDLKVYMPLLKRDKNELILQKGTELGASAFIPVEFNRSVTKISATRTLQNQLRWEKIVKEAAEQSERVTLPVLYPGLTTQDLLEKLQNSQLEQEETYCFLTREEKLPNLYQVLSQALGQLARETRDPQKTNKKSFALIFGPEGGFSKEEQFELAKFSFIKKVQLGKRILRAETAVISALSIFSNLASNLLDLQQKLPDLPD